MSETTFSSAFLLITGAQSPISRPIPTFRRPDLSKLRVSGSSNVVCPLGAFPLVPIANFGSCLLIFLSISKNMFQSWNVGACSFAIWTAIVSFYAGLNSIIWSNSTANISPIWCDISEYSISVEECLSLMTRRKQQHILTLALMQLSLPHLL